MNMPTTETNGNGSSSSSVYNENQKEADRKSVNDALEMLQSDYLLPYLAEVERATVSVAMNDVVCRLEAIQLLKPDDFYIPAYRHAFEAVITLTNRGDAVTPLTVGEYLNRKGFLTDIGGYAGLTNVYTEAVGTKKTVRAYAKRLRDKAVARNLFAIAKEIALSCFNPELNGESAVAQAEDKINSLRSQTIFEQTLKTYKQVSLETQRTLEEWRAGVATSLKTGIVELDSRLWARGAARGEVYYIGALTSFGKTALLWQILNHFEESGYRGATFTLEMTAVKLALRALQRMSGGLEFSPYTLLEIKDAKTEREIKRAEENAKTFKRATELLKRIESWDGLLDESTRNWNVMKAKIRQAHAEKKLDYIAVDYVQLVELDEVKGSRGDRRDLEIKKISNDSVALARELNAPWFWIAQLNRKNKLGTKPEFTDFKESSSIEQDADFIGFIYGKQKAGETRRKLKFYCAKQRNGRVNWEIPMDFEADKQTFVTESMVEMLAEQSPDENFFEQTALIEEMKKLEAYEATSRASDEQESSEFAQTVERVTAQKKAEDDFDW